MSNTIKVYAFGEIEPGTELVLKSEFDARQSELANLKAELAGLRTRYQQWRERCGKLSSQNKILRDALEYYAKHESVIKEAYHSNDEKQITCVHTFINHVAREAIAAADRLGQGE